MTAEIKNLDRKVNTLSLIGPAGSTKPSAESPFLPRSVKAFQQMKESCTGSMGLTEWSDDDDEAKTESTMKMEIPAFEGKDVEGFSVRFARYLLLTGKHQCKEKVKAALLIEGIKKPDVKLLAENCLKKAKSLEGFFDRLQRLYPEIETDLSLRGNLAKIGHLPADPKPAQIENLLNELHKVFEKFTRNALSNQQRLLELDSSVNNKIFMKWVEDSNLSPKLHDYDTPSILPRLRATFSVSLKHLQEPRGHGGRTATVRRMERERTEKGVPKDTDKWVMIEALEALKQELSTNPFPLEKTVAKPEETRSIGNGKGKGGRGKRTTLDADKLIAAFRARIQCKYCGKTNHYSDQCFKLQKQQRRERLIHVLKQNGFEDLEKVLQELRAKYGDTGAGKGEPKKGRGRGKGKGKGGEEKKEEPEEEGNDRKRKRVMAAEMENVIELLRAATREGHTL